MINIYIGMQEPAAGSTKSEKNLKDALWYNSSSLLIITKELMIFYHFKETHTIMALFP